MIVKEQVPAIVKRQSSYIEGMIEIGFTSWQFHDGRRIRAESLTPVCFVDEIITPFQLPIPEAVLRIARRHGIKAGLFGSAAMAAATGLPYVNESSDLDIFIEAKAYGDISNFYEEITNEPMLQAVRPDIELDIGHGYAVKLAELFTGQETILAKGLWDVRLFNLNDVKERFRQPFGDITAKNAVRALLYEAAATPKPGLVDMNNNGAHADMNFFTFIDSATALIPHFKKFFDAGMIKGGVFDRIRYLGMLAEDDMLAATGGANTHKGAIFSLGIICAAIGYLHASGGIYNTDKVLETCARMTAPALEKELKDITRETAKTFGERLYAEFGIKGVRGEAASGFLSVKEIGLPVLKAEIAKGKSVNEAAVITLLYFIAATDDTNLIKRGGPERQKEIRERARIALKNEETALREASLLDKYFIEKNLSPGGGADLLAVTLMLYFMETDVTICE